MRTLLRTEFRAAFLPRNARHKKSGPVMKKVFAVLGSLAIAASTLLIASPAIAGNPNNTNDPAYWQNLYPNAVQCYKYDSDGGAHGSVTDDGAAVVLNPFQQSWPGDRWEVLIVKGGSVDSGHGAGNAVYELPTAGTLYYPPTNAGGQQAAVSHWIVCKGQAPATASAAASFVDHTCDVVGSLTLTGEHVTFTVTTTDGTVTGLAAGTYPVRTDLTNTSSAPYYGSMTITAVPDSGYTLTGSDSPWTFTATEPTQCNQAVECDTIANGGVSTNLAANGWTISGAEYVNGGLKLTSQNWVDATATRSASFMLSHLGALVLDPATVPAGSGIGIHLTLTGGAVLVYEPLYSNDFWSNSAILPASAGGQGGPYSGSLQDVLDTIGDVAVTQITVVFSSSALSSAVLTSVTVNCTNYTFDFVPTEVTEFTAPTASDVCGTEQDTLTVPDDTDMVAYTVVDNRVGGVGSVVVTATGQAGYVIPDNVTHEWTFEFTDVPCETIRIIAPAAVDPNCDTEPVTSGYIHLDLKDHLHYAIDGVPTTQADNPRPAGTYTITVTVDDGYQLYGPASFDVTIVPVFCPPTHALITPTASMKNMTCTTSGSYTLGAHEGVLWFVGDSETPVAAGTYQVKSASTVKVHAELVDDVEDGWEEGAQTEWTFVFTRDLDCLPTLAFTGSTGGNLGLLLAGGMLLFGGAIVAGERRFRFGAK